MFAVAYARPPLPGGSLAAPDGTVISHDTTGTAWRSRSHTASPFVPVKTTGDGGRKAAGIGGSGRGPSGSGGGEAPTTCEAVGTGGGGTGIGGGRAPAGDGQRGGEEKRAAGVHRFASFFWDDREHDDRIG